MGKLLYRQFEHKAMLLQHEQVIMDLVPGVSLASLGQSMDGIHIRPILDPTDSPPAVNSLRKNIHHLFGTENQIGTSPIHHHL